jgi:hypothetical protein
MKTTYGNMIEIEKCYICLENLNDDVVYRFPLYHLKCGCLNRYHTHCLSTWLSIQNKCPICKKKINETQNIDDGVINNDLNDDDFDLEVDDNDIFYNPLASFIFVYIVYFIILLSINYLLIIIFE